MGSQDAQKDPNMNMMSPPSRACEHFMPTGWGGGWSSKQNKAERIINKELVDWGGNTSSTIILLVNP